MHFRSFRSKTLSIMVPLVLSILLLMTGISYTYARAVIVDKTNEAMAQQLAQVNNEIRKKLTAHSRLPELLSHMTGPIASELSLEQFDRMAVEGLKANPETFGMGIFFEPYRYDSKLQYFSTYAYREGGGTKVTHEYSDPSYDYPNQGWYKMVQEAQDIVYSEPYYDEKTKVTMLTAGVPVMDSNGKLAGVATGDINLSTLQEMVAETKVGETGWAFLLDKQGLMLAGPDADKVMKTKLQEDPNAEWAKAGVQIQETHSGSLTYSSGDEKAEVYYKDIPETNWTLALVIPHKELFEQLSDLMTRLMAVGGISILVMVAAISLYSRNIAKQIQAVNRFSEALAAGDFTYTQEKKGRDEFARMVENFNRTTAQLKMMIASVTEHTLHVASTAEEMTAGAEETGKASEIIAAATEDLAAGAEEQLRSSSESARAMEEMAQGIGRIAETASSAAEISLHASQEATRGNDMIRQAVLGMEELSRTVDRSALTMDKLHSYSDEIGRSIGMISAISSQTNLLALNAAIEAARAGEAGRGFAVVASEVRKLAEQTGTFADGIVRIVSELQSETAEAAESMHAGNREVKEGAHLVRESGAIFQSIYSNMGHIVDQIQEVSAASEELSAASEEVAASVDDLSQISRKAATGSQTVAASSEEQLAAMEEITASAQSLTKMVQELQDILSRFKI